VNPALIPWRSEAALVLRELGRLQNARELAATELELARHFGAPRARSESRSEQAGCSEKTSPGVS
jgi:hypothetical protein